MSRYDNVNGIRLHGAASSRVAVWLCGGGAHHCCPTACMCTPVPWSTLAVMYSRFEWFKDSAVETDPQVPEDAPDTLCEEEIEICPDLSDPWV